MEKYTFTTNLTDSEKYKLTLLIMLRSTRFRRMIRLIFIPLIVVIVLTFTIFFNSPSDPIYRESIFPVIIVPSLLLSIILIGPLIIIKLKKIGPTVYEFDNWGMTASTGNKTINVPWDDLSEYSETSKYILIRQTNYELAAHVIQKNSFSGNNEIKSFITFLGQQRLKRK